VSGCGPGKSLANHDLDCRLACRPDRGALVCGSGHGREGLQGISALTIETDFKARRYRIAAQGTTIKYLPPYNHDLNPIKQVFARLKALLPKAAERTYEML
jgi:hypothetical protein